MRFLIDADLPASLRTLFAARGHEAIHVDQVHLGAAADATIAAHARRDGRCLFTGDFDFSDIREYTPREFAGIVVLTLPRNAGRSFIERLTREFLDALPSLGPIAGKLVIVDVGRIRLRD
ncbi:MAG: hypothetical protein QOH21_3615 [Acidobacteriota bacterium]|nr:hypothetical protein [Acidobacteriota bacterium]